MKYFIFLLSILLLTAAGGTSPTAAQKNLPPEVGEMARKVLMPVVYKVLGMDKVKIVQNLKYTRTDDPNILMDVYLEKSEASSPPGYTTTRTHVGDKLLRTRRPSNNLRDWPPEALATGVKIIYSAKAHFAARLNSGVTSMLAP